MKCTCRGGTIEPAEPTCGPLVPGGLTVTQYMGNEMPSSIRITVEVRTGHPLGPDTCSLWWFSSTGHTRLA